MTGHVKHERESPYAALSPGRFAACLAEREITYMHTYAPTNVRISSRQRYGTNHSPMTMRDFPGPEITATWLGGVMMQLPASHM